MLIIEAETGRLRGKCLQNFKVDTIGGIICKFFVGDSVVGKNYDIIRNCAVSVCVASCMQLVCRR